TCARADLEDPHDGVGAVDQVMAVARCGAKAGDHAGRQNRLALVGHQHGLALQHVDQLFLTLMPMPLRRPGAGRQREQVHAELRQSEGVAQPVAAAFAHWPIVRRRVVRSDARRHVERPYGDWHRNLLGYSTAHFGGRFSAKARRPSAASGLRRASANLSAAKSSTEDRGSPPTFMTTALVSALASGAQRSICLSTSSSLASRAAESFTR